MVTEAAHRLSRINHWWNWVRLGLNDQPRLHEAFVDVLGCLSEEALTRFLIYFPLVLSLDGWCAAAIRPARLPGGPPALRERPTILAFAPDLLEQTPGGLLALVAHEVGHVVLGHLAEGAKPPKDLAPVRRGQILRFAQDDRRLRSG